MLLSERIKDNLVVVVASAFAAGAGLGWTVAESLRVKPKEDEIALLERRISDLREPTSPTNTDQRVAQLEATNKDLSKRLQRALQQNSEPTSIGPDPGEPFKASDSKTETAFHDSKTVENFLFQLKGCKRSGNAVVCSLTITNKGEDGKFYFDLRKTRLHDDRGGEYSASEGSVGDVSGKNPTKFMVTSIPLNASLTFPGVDAQARSVASLYLDCGLAGPRTKINFRDIAIRE